MPKASVGIIVRNEKKEISSLLDSVLSQDFPDYEIIVVDAHSTDGTAEILKKYSLKHRKIRIFESSLGSRGSDRNLAAQKARSSILCFIDPGGKPSAKWLSELVSEFEKQRKKYPKLAGMGGKTIFLKDTLSKRIIYSLLSSPIGSGGSMQINEDSSSFHLVDSFPNCNGVYLSAVILKEKYSSLKGGEDFEFNRRLVKKGYLLGLSEKAQITHNYIDSFSDFLRKMKSYGEMQVRSMKNSGEFRWYVPVVFFYGVYHIIALVLALFGVFFPILLSIVSQLIFFLLFGIIYSVKKRNAAFLLSFLFYPAQYFAYFAGIMKALFIYRRL
jgi:glycosyltransferase involved in cell wall biosynthesis